MLGFVGGSFYTEKRHLAVFPSEESRFRATEGYGADHGQCFLVSVRLWGRVWAAAMHRARLPSTPKSESLKDAARVRVELKLPSIKAAASLGQDPGWWVCSFICLFIHSFIRSFVQVAAVGSKGQEPVLGGGAGQCGWVLALEQLRSGEERWWALIPLSGQSLCPDKNREITETTM